MRVYVLRFRNAGSVSRAFERLMDSSRVSTCEIEPELGRVRFLAPEKYAAALLERIYLDCDLTWCSSHGLADEDATEAPARGEGASPAPPA
jgi:hypothetical protein